MRACYQTAPVARLLDRPRPRAYTGAMPPPSAVLTLLLLAAPLRGQQLELRFIDVGQADAVLVREGGKTALIDAGSSGDIVARLRALDVDTIDLAVASHNHADHIGGLRSVLVKAAPERIYAQIDSAAGWQRWGVWYRRDPQMQQSSSGPAQLTRSSTE